MDIQETLHTLGHDVRVIDLAALENYHLQVIAMLDALVAFNPDMIATVDHVGLVPYVLSVLPNPPVVLSWFFDNPLPFLRPDFHYIQERLHLFIWDESYIPRLRAEGYPHVHYQPFATNIKRHFPDTQAYRYDVSFVGSFSQARAKVITALAEAGIRVDVFGDDPWHAAASKRLVYHGPADNQTQAPNIYRQSRMNLNITSPQLIRALPVRAFDVMACGGFLLTDDRKDAGTLFRPGSDLVIYRDVPHLVELIGFYRPREKERDVIRHSGMERVRNDYSFTAVLPDMIARTMTSVQADVTTPSDTNMCFRARWLLTLSYLKHNRLDAARLLLNKLLTERPKVDVLHELQQVLTSVASGETALNRVTWPSLYAPYRAGLPLTEKGFVE
jgi:hypothetical protein